MFCYPEHIPAEMRRVFGWLGDQGFSPGRDAAAFAEGAAHFLAELNAIHPFRDGNDRTQLAFMAELAASTGHPIAGLTPRPFRRWWQASKTTSDCSLLSSE